MKQNIFLLWAGWVASYLQRSLSAQVNGGSRCHPWPTAIFCGQGGNVPCRPVILHVATIFSCDQAALQMVFSVCPSVCLSHLFDYVPIIVSSWNFQELLPMTKVRSMQKVKVRSKVKVTEVTTQLNRFRTVTPVWIDIWWWNDAYSLMLLRKGALLFFKVIRQISRSHGSKNRRIWPRLGVSGL